MKMFSSVFCLKMLYLSTASCYYVSLSENYIKMEINKWSNFTVHVEGSFPANNVVMEVNHTDHVRVSPKFVEIHSGNSSNWCHMFHVYAFKPGISRILFNFVNSSLGNDTKDLEIHLDIVKMKTLEVYGDWLKKFYYIFSTLSVYPQIFMQFLRLSVVGLDMDYVCFNSISFVSYTGYTYYTYTQMDVNNEYTNRRSEDSPVTLTENMYALNGLISAILLGIQAIKYHGVDKKVTVIGKELISFYSIVFTFGFFFAKFGVIQYSDFLYICKCIHYTCMMTKYIPQLYRNSVNKSSFGWNIWNSNLELIGSVSLMSHLFIMSYNYDSWMDTVRSPVLWMAFIIPVQHLAFIVQHYFIYRKRFEFDLSDFQEITLQEKISLYEQKMDYC